MMAEKKRRSPVKFLREVRQEINKVTWPTRKETTVSTMMVFIMVTFVAVFFFFVDKSLSALVRMILGIGA